MKDSSPIIHRAQKKRAAKLQEGTILSFTTLAHPPKQFGKHPRTIGLILLEDGSQVLGQLTGAVPAIGMHVRPRMKFGFANDDGLRVYDIAYEVLERKKASTSVDRKRFPGYILALTGPSGVGKSTVSRLLTQLCSDYLVNVPIITTRAPKNGDEGEYLYASVEEFNELKAKGAVVAVTHIPSSSEERHYGYRAEDIEAIWKGGRLPVVITEMHLLQGLARHFGRRSILSFGLLPPGKSKRAMLSQLLFRLRKRGRDTEEHIQDRLKNAEKDLAFFRERKDLFDHLVVNEDLPTVIEHMKKQVPGLGT